MNIIKSKADFVQFMLDPDSTWTRIDIIIGENFRTFKGYSFQLNSTPLTDATLVPFSNFQIENKKMLRLEVDVNRDPSIYQIDLTKNKAALPVAEFIEEYNKRNFKIKTTYTNSFKVEFDKQFFKLQIEDISYNDANIENKKWLIVCKNKYGVYSQIKEPLISQKRYEQLKEVELSNDLLTVNCTGKDVWSETSTEPSTFRYTWKLNIQSEFFDIVRTLITMCSKLMKVK